MSKKNTTSVYRKIALVLGVIAAIVGLYLSGAFEFFETEKINQNLGLVEQFVGENYVLSVLAYMAVYIANVALSLPFATLLTLSGGFLFGIIGTLYVVISATIGATFLFLASRYLLGDWIQTRYGDTLAAFNKDLEQNGSNYLLTLRFIPLFPFFLINALSGLTKVRTSIFIWTTFVGIIPGSFVYVYTGQQLSDITQTGDILSSELIFAFILLGIFALIPTVYNKLKKNS